MKVFYKYDEQLNRIVLTSEIEIHGAITPIHKYLTINPNSKAVVHQSLWELEHKDTHLFSTQEEMNEFLGNLENDDTDKNENARLSAIEEIQEIIRQHYQPITIESLKDTDLDDSAKALVIQYLDALTILQISAIQMFHFKDKLSISLKMFFADRTYLAFSCESDKQGQIIDDFLPIRITNLDFDPEDMKANKDKYFEWTWSNLTDEQIRVGRSACKYIHEKLPELFLYRGKNQIFLN